MPAIHTIHLATMYIEVAQEGNFGYKKEECDSLVAKVSELAHERGLKYQRHPLRFEDNPNKPTHTIEAMGLEIFDILRYKNTDEIYYQTVHLVSIMEKF